jgi:RNA polymerase sigma factor (sigma-70 family)
LRHEDAEDAVQNTIAACAHAYKTYDRTIGALHSWVFRIAQNKIIDLQRARPQEVVSADGSGTRILNTVPDPHAERSWNTEHRKTMLRKCLEPVRREFSAQIILAFELYALKGEDATEVARKLGVQRNVVYVWKNRVLARMRQRRSELEAILQGLA